MYHAAATVSTLLLKLGEVSRKYRSSSVINHQTSEKIINTEIKSALKDKSQTISEPLNDFHENDPSLTWSITFEQLIASLLTDNLLVTYFDQRFDLDKKLTEYKSQHA